MGIRHRREGRSRHGQDLVSAGRCEGVRAGPGGTETARRMTLRYIIFALYVLSTVPTTALADDPFQTAPAPQASPPTSAYHPRPAQPEAEPPAAASPAPPVAATPVPASPRGFANRS